ncbi:Response regulator receiver domain-containing protein [Flavobacteriaceae bacterium MAR_2010_188]|nr:Response regulator receiver domain-containing protein [Flavobacteriaceae bacterium MAR_2010_188]
MLSNCIIVDNELPALKVLQTYVESVPQLKIIMNCKSAFETIHALNTENIDLIFLDIQMSKMIGTKFLKSLPHPPKVIFTTASKDFAYEAWELDAIDYLLKPISFQRFLRAINKFSKLDNIEKYSGKK